MHSQSAISAVIRHQSTDPLFNPPEAAEYIGISKDTLSVWRCTGRYDIPFIKVGRLVKYRKSALDAFLNRRVMELRKHGVGIITIKIDRASDCGKIHRVACYELEVGAVAPAPADKADGIHRQETDTSENSTEGRL